MKSEVPQNAILGPPFLLNVNELAIVSKSSVPLLVNDMEIWRPIQDMSDIITE